MDRSQRSLIERIEINPDILVGKPVIKGTRISVEQIMRMLASGMDAKEILEEHPHITKEDIRAAIFYATELVQDFKVYPRRFIHRIKLA
ncbi:MAG: DUF433 domain-containing protein [Candidatus Portnoybacteria bacterium]|nr:DUF433 domain-containing protein [Candidatus Portnoybacteria bacterium]